MLEFMLCLLLSWIERTSTGRMPKREPAGFKAAGGQKQEQHPGAFARGAAR
jgi:hypothetical protein